ncbi:MAG: chemotaxis response regulator protein-glutamate methylesterase [Clostridia bacterium]|nr:chemotaxis response regulator protein-glutamate methylesterase [Clostridia bacterium]
MALKRKIKVLVVDDSLLFREAIARGIGQDSGIEVVGTASDAFQARDMIQAHEPDVLSLDVEMPKMNGIEFLKRLMPQYPMPVVVVSAVSDNVFDALNAGAVDFVTKPEAGRPGGVERLVRELIVKIKIASMAKVGRKAEPAPAAASAAGAPVSRRACDLIAIGASTGGTEAVLEIIRAFPQDMPPVLIVQHMPPGFTRMYAERLNRNCAMRVKEAEDGDELRRGLAILAAGECHMSLRKTGRGFVIDSRPGERVNGHCPSVDVLFHSVSRIKGLHTIGIILTGMGYDGAKGLEAMKNEGAFTIGQDEASSVVYGMPKVAYDIGAVMRQVPLNQIADLVFTTMTGR